MRGGACLLTALYIGLVASRLVDGQAEVGCLGSSAAFSGDGRCGVPAGGTVMAAGLGGVAGVLTACSGFLCDIPPGGSNLGGPFGRGGGVWGKGSRKGVLAGDTDRPDEVESP